MGDEQTRACLAFPRGHCAHSLKLSRMRVSRNDVLRTSINPDILQSSHRLGHVPPFDYTMDHLDLRSPPLVSAAPPTRLSKRFPRCGRCDKLLSSSSLLLQPVRPPLARIQKNPSAWSVASRSTTRAW